MGKGVEESEASKQVHHIKLTEIYTPKHRVIAVVEELNMDFNYICKVMNA